MKFPEIFTRLDENLPDTVKQSCGYRKDLGTREEKVRWGKQSAGERMGKEDMREAERNEDVDAMG